VSFIPGKPVVFNTKFISMMHHFNGMKGKKKPHMFILMQGRHLTKSNNLSG
jgi:hypothetical protein